MMPRYALAVMLVAGLTSAASVARSATEIPSGPTAPQNATLDLSKPFNTRSAWRLVATYGSPVKDYGDNDAPGALTLCLHKDARAPCISDPVTFPKTAATDSTIAWEPHYLLTAKIVYPRGSNAAPFLLIVTGSLNSGDGDQVVSTQLVAYDIGRDAFRRVYGKSTGHNNNQEIRFVTGGPLRGAVISAEPQEHAPYGFWIVVDKLKPEGAYRQALRYPSATRYNDGNSLAVIYSEMPNIERRLGLWKPGDPIPTPGQGKPCLQPQLRHE